MRPLHILTQDVITKDHTLDLSACPQDAHHSVIDTEGWKSQIAGLEADPALKEQRPLIFCSLAIASHIARNCPELARGLVLPRRFLVYHVYSSLLGADASLNPGGIFMPWGDIMKMHTLLEHAYPKGLFVRPNSPMKPFTGFACGHDDLAREWHAMGQAAMISADEMCYICEIRDIPVAEYRCWMVDGEVVTSASYGWEETSEAAGPAPEEVIRAAHSVAQQVEMAEQVFTADFVITAQGAKLVELNATSTSGWYAGMSPEKLISALEPLFV